MNLFQKKLLKLGRGSMAASIVLIVIALVAALYGVSQQFISYNSFDAISDGYAKMDITYLMGPFATQTQDGKTSDEYYVAETTDGYWFVVDTGRSTDLPVYGEDVLTDEDISALTPQTVYGTSTELSGDLSFYLVDFFADTGAGITTLNYSDYFGSYYLDTTSTGSDISMMMYLFAAILAFLGVILFLPGMKRTRQMKLQLSDLEQSGQLQRLYEDFDAGPSVYSSKLKLAVSPHWIVDVTAANAGFHILPLNNITNVFKCNMLGGEPTSTSYIALETEEGERYCVAPCRGRLTEFDAVLAQLKQIVMQGGAAV